MKEPVGGVALTSIVWPPTASEKASSPGQRWYIEDILAAINRMLDDMFFVGGLRTCVAITRAGSLQPVDARDCREDEGHKEPLVRINHSSKHEEEEMKGRCAPGGQKRNFLKELRRRQAPPEACFDLDKGLKTSNRAVFV